MRSQSFITRLYFFVAIHRSIGQHFGKLIDEIAKRGRLDIMAPIFVTILEQFVKKLLCWYEISFSEF